MSDDAEAKKTLLEQAKVLHLEVDGRWSVETLAEKVQGAQESHTALNAKAVKDASDTWVYLHKDAFPTDDEKCLAGSVIKVPAAMAKEWYRRNAARPAGDDEIENG